MRYAEGRWAADRWARESGRFFSVGGRSTLTSSAANDVSAHLWNPSGTRSLWILEYMVTGPSPNTVDPWRVCRTTTAGGTPSSTVTPDLDNDFEREITPATGAVLHLGNFATEPVLAVPELARVAWPATAQPGFMITWLFPDGGVRVPPGTGLGLATTGAVGIPNNTDHLFRFRE